MHMSDEMKHQVEKSAHCPSAPNSSKPLCVAIGDPSCVLVDTKLVCWELTVDDGAVLYQVLHNVLLTLGTEHVGGVQLRL